MDSLKFCPYFILFSIWAKRRNEWQSGADTSGCEKSTNTQGPSAIVEKRGRGYGRSHQFLQERKPWEKKKKFFFLSFFFFFSSSSPGVCLRACVCRASIGSWYLLPHTHFIPSSSLSLPILSLPFAIHHVYSTHTSVLYLIGERERESGSGSFYSSYSHSYYTLSAHNVNSFSLSLSGWSRDRIDPFSIPAFAFSLSHVYSSLFSFYTLFSIFCVSLSLSLSQSLH